MASTIEVYRGSGLRRGSDISAPLLSDSVLVERGIAEMNANAHQSNVVVLGVVVTAVPRLGQLIEASDPSSAQMYRAKITGISLSSSDGDVTMTLTVERPNVIPT